MNDPENIDLTKWSSMVELHSSVDGGVLRPITGVYCRPDGSTATLRDADQSECGIIADLAGTTLGTTRRGHHGCCSRIPQSSVSSDSRRCSAHQSAWDHPTADLDLHLIRLNPTPTQTKTTLPPSALLGCRPIVFRRLVSGEPPVGYR